MRTVYEIAFIGTGSHVHRVIAPIERRSTRMPNKKDHAGNEILRGLCSTHIQMAPYVQTHLFLRIQNLKDLLGRIKCAW